MIKQGGRDRDRRRHGARPRPPPAAPATPAPTGDGTGSTGGGTHRRRDRPAAATPAAASHQDHGVHATSLDVTFWANGKKRKIKGMEKLDMLPNQVIPLLIFLGVSDNGGNAVFLVDSTLKADRRGQVQAQPRRLRVPVPGRRLRGGVHQRGRRLLHGCAIDEIRKVKVGASRLDATGAKAGKSARRAPSGRPSGAPLRASRLLDRPRHRVQSTHRQLNGADQRR